MLAKISQSVALAMAVAFSFVAAFDISWLEPLYNSIRPILKPILDLPLVQHSLDTLPHYRYVEVALVVSWLLALVTFGTAILSFTCLLIRGEKFECRSTRQAAAILYAKVYEGIFLYPLNSGRYMKSQSTNVDRVVDKVDSHSGSTTNSTEAIPKIMLMAIHAPTVKKQLFFAALFCPIWIWLSLTGLRGSSVSFANIYIGYPLLHIVFGTLLAELVMFLIAALVALIQQRGNKKWA